MTQITKKKVILIAMIRKAEKIGGRVSLRVVRKPLLTAVMKQKRLGRRKHLLNDLEKKNGIRLSSFQTKISSLLFPF